jgi:hypothetical protein
MENVIGVAYRKHGKDAYKIFVINLKGKCHSEELGVDWKIILE